LGQKEPVTVYYLLAENTADEKIWFILRRKMEIVGQMLGKGAVPAPLNPHAGAFGASVDALLTFYR
jgi:SNF2 family DNA or RNA helicase